MSRDTRQKRDLHALNADGMVVCNPRDKEATHRAEIEDIATDDYTTVTCRKCLDLLFCPSRTFRGKFFTPSSGVESLRQAGSLGSRPHATPRTRRPPN